MPDIACLKKFIEKNFSHFGINKKNEILRLLYEISEREKTSFLKIADDLKDKNFTLIKKYLLKRRYPYTLSTEVNPHFYLPKLEIKKENALKIKKFKIYPKYIYVEKEVENSYLVKRFKEIFPLAKVLKIGSLKDYLKSKRYSLKDYNLRTQKFFIVKERFDFIKRCPCTKKAFSCNYFIFNLGFGCPYECIYCYLQGYTNFSGILFPANLEDFFNYFKKLNFPKGLRIGSGEFTDSLCFDEITQYSYPIVEFFKKYPHIYFEFKTKSKNIKNFLNLKPAKNIVVSWSLNPQKIIKENEFYTANLKERIDSASKCAQAGFKLGFHLDPIIYYSGWFKDYQQMLDYLFEKIKPKDILWISLGTLRFNPSLKKVIENRFPQNKILDEELILGFDNKLRYPLKLRQEIYQKIKSYIQKINKNLYLYLCMEKIGTDTNF